MNNTVRLIDHLLKQPHSIDTFESIIMNLRLSKNLIMAVINDERYQDFFQRLSPSENYPQAPEKLVLTLDLFCCTHYPQECRNLSCSFLHLCQYSFRPMYGKCTNKRCEKEHDILNSEHNLKILETRRLLDIPKVILHDIVRASADPQRSLWACPDFLKKEGCSQRKRCDKLHYCYFALIDACTKPRCSHVLNDDCLHFLRHREISHQNTDDILKAFKKVLQQRKSDYVLSLSIASTVNRLETISSTNRNSISIEKYPSKLETLSLERTTLPCISNNIFPTESEVSTPARFQDTDIFLLDYVNQNQKEAEEKFLSENFNFPMKLVVSKVIQSKAKEILCNSNESVGQYWYLPVPKNGSILRILRLQIEPTNLQRSIKIYRNVRDAHENCDQQDVSNQFCLLRIRMFQQGFRKSASSTTEKMEIPEPSQFFFDRLWCYCYNL